jgi:hypothetical protein
MLDSVEEREYRPMCDSGHIGFRPVVKYALGSKRIGTLASAASDESSGALVRAPFRFKKDPRQVREAA